MLPTLRKAQRIDYFSKKGSCGALRENKSGSLGKPGWGNKEQGQNADSSIEGRSVHVHRYSSLYLQVFYFFISLSSSAVGAELYYTVSSY